LSAMALAAALALPGARAAGVVDAATGIIAGLVLILLYLSASMLGGLPARRPSTASVKGR
ncbi:MAG TPA: MauE/DoxX family redox-associated membrane protein, partial [Paracoccus solventivorans]|nr:MauE/DoxX family redox-associated membrane protein [Paracoccus solventivorans]